MKKLYNWAATPVSKADCPHRKKMRKNCCSSGAEKCLPRLHCFRTWKPSLPESIWLWVEAPLQCIMRTCSHLEPLKQVNSGVQSSRTPFELGEIMTQWGSLGSAIFQSVKTTRPDKYPAYLYISEPGLSLRFGSRNDRVIVREQADCLGYSHGGVQAITTSVLVWYSTLQ